MTPLYRAGEPYDAVTPQSQQGETRWRCGVYEGKTLYGVAHGATEPLAAAAARKIARALNELESVSL